ncbi:hypothetical protein A2721_00310 [Candidatus Gottesmanbacteria bacterium RIFCSPHIGHO2_01_FULL_47_48]|uniref:Uncharacterized protein n=1 Tax=Candidatus Gottesmanbacteria bacterium RIFCSPHIGHO2_01_FULL_47_48 TaxID=1798381 RepID=A0A1F6A109_9BACT|nr:MAG: hypothetical protein A2721_00310 [Candidatus Gottesmanbacteria bacterium RIFCSPHIGHO2_01_FULL_47_48]
MRKYLLILTLVGFLLYLPSLTGPFLWDDEDFVYANEYVRDFRIDKFFTDSQTAGRGKLSNYYRPLPQIAYASVHAIFGFNPFWYHLLNVLAHITAACAILSFFYVLLNSKFEYRNPKQIKNSNDQNSKRLEHLKFENSKIVSDFGFRASDLIAHYPLLIALLFLVHPVQTEAVSYISGLSDPLFVLFGFLSLIFYLLKNERKNMIPLSLFFFTLSLLSKETGAVFLPILITLAALDELIKQNLSDRIGIVKLINWKNINALTKSVGPYAMATLVYLWYHFSFINSLDIKSAWGNNPYANSLLVRLLTFIQNFPAYIGLLIFPKDLFMERDYTVQIQTQALNLHLIGLIILIGLVGLFLWRLHQKLLPPPSSLLTFCFTGFFISFLPYTGLVLINGIFYEHFLYLPLVFFFAFWIILISSLNRPTFLTPLITLIMFLFILRNLSRQLDWTDSVRFYSQTLKHAPNSIRIINGLGMAYAEKGDLDSAIREYSLLISVNPHVPHAYHNLANAYAAKGDLANAEKNYLKALEVDPNFFYSLQSLANLYQQTGQKEKLHNLLLRFNVQ